MAASIPNQNNLNDVIKASTALLKEVRQAITEYNDQKKKDKSTDIKEELTHIKTDMQSVVDFINDMGDIAKNIDNVTDKLVTVLGVPSKINKKLTKVKVESIDTKLLGALGQSLDLIFGKGGIVDNIENATKRMDSFKEVSGKKLTPVLDSVSYLSTLTSEIARFGRNSNRYSTELKLAAVGATNITQFLGVFANTLKEVNNLDIADSSIVQGVKGSIVGDLLILPVKLWMLVKVIQWISRVMRNMAGLILYLPLIATLVITFDAINKALDKLVSVIDTLNKFNLSVIIGLTIKVPVLSRVVRMIAKRLIRSLIIFNRYLPAMIVAITALNIADGLLTKLSDIILKIEKVKIATLIVNLLKIRLLAANARLLRTLIVHLGRLATTALRYSPSVAGLSVALTLVLLYSSIIETIRGTKTGLFFSMKVRHLIIGAKAVKIFIRSIAHLISAKIAAKALVAVKLTNMIIKSFASVILNILLLTPLMTMFILFSPIIIVIFWIFAKVFRIIVRILAKLISPRVIIVLAAVTGVVVLLAMFGVALIALALISTVIIDNALNIILFFGVVIAVALLIGLLGVILLKVSPLLIAAIVGIGMVAIAVFAVLAIAVMLQMLGEIKLDYEKIKENVKQVMSTVLFIITSLFDEELNDPKSKDSVFAKIVKVLGGAVAKIITAIATCVILVATVASVACILMIASMLRLLQKIDFDENKVLANVDRVFNTVEQIISRFMAEDKDGKKSNRGIMLSVIAWACPPLAKIAEAMLSMAYLFLMLLATTLVLGIASVLRLLQNLNLDTGKIQANVDAVFNTVDQIINRIFGDRKDDEHKSGRGILVTIVSWVDEGLAKIVEAALSIVYLALALFAITLVLAMASMLRLLQELDLNADKITENVDVVFNTMDQIINRIFGDRKDDEHPSSRGILVSIISWVDPGLANIAEAALSVVYLMLALAAISIVVGIAGLLSLIQDIGLDEKKIQANVASVFNAIDEVINRVFAPVEDDIAPGRGILGKIIGLFNPGLAQILDALMSIVYVSLAFVAISVVLGIAKSLKEIQDLDINEKIVTQKVDTIFKTVAHIMRQIYEKSDDLLPPPKDRGIFSSIIGFFSPELESILDALTMIAKLAMVQTAISAVAGVGMALKQIQDIDVDLSSAGEKVDQVMSIAENVCTKIFSRESKIQFPVPPEERKSVFGALISWAFGGKSDEERALEAAMKKVEALGVIEAAVGALGNILAGAKRIVDMDVKDLAGAQSKVDEVMEMAAHLSESIFNSKIKLVLPQPSEDEVKAALVDLGLDHWWRSATSGETAKAAAHASMKLAMRRVETLGLIASAVGSIASIIEGVNKINNFKTPNLASIRKKVQEVMTVASEVSFTIFNQDGIGQRGGNASGIKAAINEINARVDFAKAGSDGVCKVNDSLANLASKVQFSPSQITATKTKATSTISAIGEIIAQMDSIEPENNGERVRTNCDLMDRISKTIGSFVQVSSDDVKNSRSITENYIKFFKYVDSMDIKKLQHTDWLMRSWASISRDLKGDFEGLAKTINNHIMPMLTKVNETLEKTTKAQQDIINVMSQPVDLNNGTGSTPTFSNSGSQQSAGSGSSGGSSSANPGGISGGIGSDAGVQSGTNTRTTSTAHGKKQPTGFAGIDPDTMKDGKTYKITIAKVEKA